MKLTKIPLKWKVRTKNMGKGSREVKMALTCHQVEAYFFPGVPNQMKNEDQLQLQPGQHVVITAATVGNGQPREVGRQGIQQVGGASAWEEHSGGCQEVDGCHG